MQLSLYEDAKVECPDGFDPLAEVEDMLAYFGRVPEFQAEHAVADRVLSIMRRSPPTQADFDEVESLMTGLHPLGTHPGSGWSNFFWAVRCWHKQQAGFAA